MILISESRHHVVNVRLHLGNRGKRDSQFVVNQTQPSDSREDLMSFELTDFEWSAIQPILPQKSRGVPRVDDRRVLNGIFWVLRSGAPWADLPGRYGPHTTF